MTAAAHPRSRLRERLRILGFTLAVTLVFGSGVSFVQVATQPRVRRNEALHLRRAVRAAAGLPALSDVELPAWFETAVRETAPGRYRVCDPGGGASEVRVFVEAGAGLWGRIRAAVGVSGSAPPRLAGLALLEQNETPGLGARIAEPWFAEQLRGKSGPLRLVPEGTRSARPDEIDAITGATITSVAVRDLLNRVLSCEAAAPPAAERRASDGQEPRR